MLSTSNLTRMLTRIDCFQNQYHHRNNSQNIQIMHSFSTMCILVSGTGLQNAHLSNYTLTQCHFARRPWRMRMCTYARWTKTVCSRDSSSTWEMNSKTLPMLRWKKNRCRDCCQRYNLIGLFVSVVTYSLFYPTPTLFSDIGHCYIYVILFMNTTAHVMRAIF